MRVVYGLSLRNVPSVVALELKPIFDIIVAAVKAGNDLHICAPITTISRAAIHLINVDDEDESDDDLGCHSEESCFSHGSSSDEDESDESDYDAAEEGIISLIKHGSSVSKKCKITLINLWKKEYPELFIIQPTETSNSESESAVMNKGIKGKHSTKEGSVESDLITPVKGYKTRSKTRSASKTNVI